MKTSKIKGVVRIQSPDIKENFRKALEIGKKSLEASERRRPAERRELSKSTFRF